MTPSDGVSERFDRLPSNPTHSEGPSRAEVCVYFADRFGIDRSIFDPFTFWERGRGKIWAFRGTAESPVEAEGLGIHLLRTRGTHWKPTTTAVQTFGHHASRNVICLGAPADQKFWQGIDQSLEWDGEWGYLIVAHEVGGTYEPLGVGLYLDGTLRSVVPKARQDPIVTAEPADHDR